VKNSRRFIAPNGLTTNPSYRLNQRSLKDHLMSALALKAERGINSSTRVNVRFSPESGHVQCRSAHVSYGASAEISRSTRRVRFTSLRVVPNFFYRSLNFFCRLVETFAPALRQGSRGNGNPISLRLWPVPRDHGSAPIRLRTSHTNQFIFPTAPPGRRKLPSCPLCPQKHT